MRSRTTSSMVMDDSAMLVAITTLRWPRGGRSKMPRCCAVGMEPCSGYSSRSSPCRALIACWKRIIVLSLWKVAKLITSQAA